MKRVLKWLAIGAGTIVGLLLVAVAVVYALSGRRIAGRFETDPSPVVVTDDSATIAHGERLARIHGCLACHGKNLAGQVAFEQALLGRFVAPNLTRVSREYSDLDFVRLLRHGVRPNGTGVVGMPSSSFAHLADEDLAAIIAYVRTVPFNDAVLPSTRYGLLARVMLLAGRFDLQPNLMDGSRPPNALPDAQNPEIFGRYLAASTCTECHGADLMGTDGFMATPSLAVVGGYSREEFREFLRTGVALGGRTLAIMSAVAKARFAHFTDDEIDALYAYFETLAAPAEDRRAITPS